MSFGIEEKERWGKKKKRMRRESVRKGEEDMGEGLILIVGRAGRELQEGLGDCWD